MIRLVPCHGKVSLLEQFPKELSQCGKMGGNTTLVVMADVDDDCEHCDALKKKYRQAAKDAHIADDLFNQVVFVFPKDRIENWIQYLNTGTTDETREGPRVSNPDAVSAARKLAEKCKSGSHNDDFPPSLKWSCKNWKTLLDRMQHD
jgi:hypothetical protein